MMITRLLCYSLLCLAALAMLCPGQPVMAQSELGKRTPIHIEANRMTSLEKERAVVFSGHVKAKQGELLINADEMTVYHGEQSDEQQAPAGQPQIDRLHAKGHVEIVQQDFVATGDAAEYYSSTGKVILTGNAKIIQNNNMVTGHKIEMDLSKGSTVIIPDEKKKGRVKGYFYPANTEQKAPQKAAEQAAPDTKQDPAQPQERKDGDSGN